MATKYECDRCKRQFDTPDKLTRVSVPSQMPNEKTPDAYDLCDADLRDLSYFLKERVTRDRHGNETRDESPKGGA